MREFQAAELLRRFEPVLRFNRGERFFPMDVSTYVRGAGLWVGSGKAEPQCVVPAGKLTLDNLGEHTTTDERDVVFLRAAAPLTPAEMAKHALGEQRRELDPRDRFRAGRGRLTRVGYTSRIMDALFSLSLLARGRVPGDLATAAAIAYREEMRRSEKYRYYGRVVECSGWLVLQYWYFYFFNDWRSRFFGTNDHEADWESLSIFLDPDGPDGPQPMWIVSSCHEYPPVVLRRRWQGSDVETRGEHPVIYVGAGSHAGYYRAGDYLAEVELPVLRPLLSTMHTVRAFWREQLHQYTSDQHRQPPDGHNAILSVPFVDYARGDGHGIGEGEERAWAEPGILNPPPQWVCDYRGLWGYYANDPVSGEDAPPGPMYERDGSMRLSWQDPVAWAGLTSLPPPSRVPEVLAQMETDLERGRGDRAEWIDGIRKELQRIGIELRSIESRPHARERSRRLRQREVQLMRQLTVELEALAEDEDSLDAVREHGESARSGSSPSIPRQDRALRPISSRRLRAGRLAEVWAAVSVGALLLALVGLAAFAREHLLLGSLVLISWYVIIEALFRNRLQQLVTVVTVALALVAFAVLVIEFHRPLAFAFAVAVGLFLLWGNIKELWT